ncbi:DUF2637 domain-containing protein [Oerskovia paurometabola]|uniref:DUF2637 domain-containing protein n=1 Tax=Oerskovia paurometabola TaxID=162170 RepID=UPI003818017A
MSATAAAQTLPHRPDTERPTMTAQTTAHRPARINPDRTAVLAVVLVLIAALIGASAALSYAGLSAVAAWAGIAPAMGWLVPVFIEGAILAYTGAGVVHQARDEKGRARQAWSWVTLWTLVSSAANGAHAWDAGPGGWQGIVGVALAALFPIGVLIAVHTAAGLIVATVNVSHVSEPGAVAALVEPTFVAPAPIVALEEAELTEPATVVYDQAASAETIVATVVAECDVMDSDERRDVAVVALEEAQQTEPATVVYDQAASTETIVATVAAERDVTDLRDVSTSRRASRGATDDRRIVELARTTHLSGTKIAEQLGTNKNRTCSLVRQVRDDMATADALWVEHQSALA